MTKWTDTELIQLIFLSFQATLLENVDVIRIADLEWNLPDGSVVVLMLWATSPLYLILFPIKILLLAPACTREHHAKVIKITVWIYGAAGSCPVMNLTPWIESLSSSPRAIWKNVYYFPLWYAPLPMVSHAIPPCSYFIIKLSISDIKTGGIYTSR